MQRFPGGGSYPGLMMYSFITTLKSKLTPCLMLLPIFFMFSFLVMLPTLPYSTSEHQVVFKAAHHPASGTSHGYHDMDSIEDKLMWLSVATQRSIILHIFFTITEITQWPLHPAGEDTGLHFTSQTGLLQP